MFCWRRERDEEAFFCCFLCVCVLVSAWRRLQAFGSLAGDKMASWLLMTSSCFYKADQLGNVAGHLSCLLYFSVMERRIFERGRRKDEFRLDEQVAIWFYSVFLFILFCCHFLHFVFKLACLFLGELKTAS